MLAGKYLLTGRGRPSFSAKRISALAGGFALGLLGMSDASMALNGYTNVSTCATCKTLADFTTAARAEAQYVGSPGTFAVVSSNNFETAYISVTGTVVMVERDGSPEPELRGVASAPVDESGNSLAGESESSLENFFNYLDQTNFMGNRNAPTGILGVPASDAGSYTSFIGADLDDLGARISNWITTDLNWVSETLPIGTIVTIEFPDHTSAQFIKVSTTATIRWEWTGKAWNAQHQPINQNGTLVNNPNSSGGGTGAFNWGTNPGYALNGSNTCVTSTTVTIGGEVVFFGWHFLPC
jgi:hypothetical protein